MRYFVEKKMNKYNIIHSYTFIQCCTTFVHEWCPCKYCLIFFYNFTQCYIRLFYVNDNFVQIYIICNPFQRKIFKKVNAKKSFSVHRLSLSPHNSQVYSNYIYLWLITLDFEQRLVRLEELYINLTNNCARSLDAVRSNHSWKYLKVCL